MEGLKPRLVYSCSSYCLCFLAILPGPGRNPPPPTTTTTFSNCGTCFYETSSLLEVLQKPRQAIFPLPLPTSLTHSLPDKGQPSLGPVLWAPDVLCASSCPSILPVVSDSGHLSTSLDHLSSLAQIDPSATSRFLFLRPQPVLGCQTQIPQVSFSLYQPVAQKP